MGGYHSVTKIDTTRFFSTENVGDTNNIGDILIFFSLCARCSFSVNFWNNN